MSFIEVTIGNTPFPHDKHNHACRGAAAPADPGPIRYRSGSPSRRPALPRLLYLENYVVIAFASSPGGEGGGGVEAKEHVGPSASPVPQTKIGHNLRFNFSSQWG